MDFADRLTHYQRKVERRLVAFLDGKRAEYARTRVEQWVYDVLDDFVMRGGKRLRAVMAITAYEGATGAFDDERIILPAVALEFLDAYFLVQDDVIDCSELRRGKPSAHAMLESRAMDMAATPAPEAAAFGRNVAIGVGDIYNAWAIECLLDSDFPIDRRLAALATYNSACEVICRGEIKDIYLGLSTVEASEDEYLDMIREKTVFYVTRSPALIGLDLGGASEELRRAVVAFMEPLGLAFQIRDDILDLTSTEEELGKPIGTDLREGKDTLIIIHAREHASPAQWKAIEQVLGDRAATTRAICRAREALEEIGSIAHAERSMGDYLGAAQRALEGLAACGLLPQSVEFYRGLTGFVGQRRH